MTAEARKDTNIMLRNDTILGVCEAIGEDLGINANWLRVAFCVPMFWNPLLVIGAYLALGLIVAAVRLAFPDRKVAIHSGSKPAAVEAPAAARAEEHEPELIAA